MNERERIDKSTMPEESLQEISFANGALELETPADGATIGNPPNGGLRAWLIVLSCFWINFLQSLMYVAIKLALLGSMSSDTGTDKEALEHISDQFLTMSDIYAPFAALVMIFLGYAPTVCIGAGVVIATLFGLSFLGDEAVGIGFIRLGVLIPVLEYFTTKRLRALILSGLGFYLGEIILIVSFILFPNLLEFNWRVYLRASSALCVGIGLIGLTLKNRNLTMENDQSVTFVQRTLGLVKKDILRSVLLWITFVVYFFYQFGIALVQTGITHPETPKQLNINGDIAKTLFIGLSQPIGLVVGLFAAGMFKKAALKDDSCCHCIKLKNNLWNFIVVTLMINSLATGIAGFCTNDDTGFLFFFPFSLITAAFIGFCEKMRDDIIPEQFGRDNIRFVEGLIFMAAGLGGSVANEVSASIEKDWTIRNVRAGGLMLMISTAVTAFVLFLKERMALDQITIGGKRSKVQTNTIMESNSIRRRGGNADITQ